MTVELTLGDPKYTERNITTWCGIDNVRIRDNELYIGGENGYFCASSSMVISMHIREEPNGGT